MQMFVGGEWVTAAKSTEVRNPYDDTVIDTVPRGTPADVQRAVTTLVEGAGRMRKLSALERSQLLRRAAGLMRHRAESLAETLSLESGKPITDAQAEVSRSVETLEVSADEAKRLVGEMIPLDAAPNGAGKLGFTLRVPCGVVAAITPFNFPLNLVCHKVGPAIAGGNAVLIKPASDTPLSSLKLVEILLEAGLPGAAIACVTGAGGELGAAIGEDDRIRKISFTGSAEVGTRICQQAGIKRVTLELGGNGPVIILDDADVEAAATAIASSGYAYAGQTCISTQRILVTPGVADDFLDALHPRVAALRMGDPRDPQTQLGPMIRASDAQRVSDWIDEAVAAGARRVLGSAPQGTMLAPAILDHVTPSMKVSCEELFGPAVAITRCADVDEALRLANDPQYGLAAGIFTRNLEHAFRFAREVDAGNLHINWTTQWRADLMPYGGLKQSGLGKEGPRYTLREMTEEKLVVLHS